MASSFKDVTNKDVTACFRKPKHPKEENSKSKKDMKGYFYDNAENCEPNIYSYFARLSEKTCTRQYRKEIWDVINRLFHCSCRNYFCCFPLAPASIRPLPLESFFQISLKNSQLEATHNAFRDCRVHFLLLETAVCLKLFSAWCFR